MRQRVEGKGRSLGVEGVHFHCLTEHCHGEDQTQDLHKHNKNRPAIKGFRDLGVKYKRNFSSHFLDRCVPAQPYMKKDILPLLQRTLSVANLTYWTKDGEDRAAREERTITDHLEGSCDREGC